MGACTSAVSSARVGHAQRTNAAAIDVRTASTARARPRQRFEVMAAASRIVWSVGRGPKLCPLRWTRKADAPAPVSATRRWPPRGGARRWRRRRLGSAVRRATGSGSFDAVPRRGEPPHHVDGLHGLSVGMRHETVMRAAQHGPAVFAGGLEVDPATGAAVSYGVGAGSRRAGRDRSRGATGQLVYAERATRSAPTSYSAPSCRSS